MSHTITAGIYFALAISIPTVASAAVSTNEQPTTSVATNLAVCLGKFDAGKGYSSYVPGMAKSRAAASAAFNRLLPALQVIDPSSYLRQIAEVEKSYQQELLREPLLIREKLANLGNECDINAAQAQEFRAALDRRDAQAEAAKAAEQKARLDMARAEQQARLDAEKAERDHRIEQERLSAEAEKAKAEADRIRASEIAKSNEFQRSEALAKLEAQKAEATKATAEAQARKAEAISAGSQAKANVATTGQFGQRGLDARAASAETSNAGNPLNSPGSADVATSDFRINGKIAMVQNIALGAGPSACPTTISKATWSSGYGEEFFAYVCEFGKSNDKTTVFYDITGKRVVSVFRRLGINMLKVKAKDVVKSAEDHYGEPTFSDPGNYLLAYGNMFEVDGKTIKNKKTGQGLKISAGFCAARFNDCSDLADATMSVEFRLSDAAAYDKSVEDGKAAYKAGMKAEAKNVSF